MDRKPLGVGFLLLLCITATVSFGMHNSPNQYQIRQFTDENGLPQNSINDMAFDNAGFAWLATQGGLVRFDGRTMTTYTKTKLAIDSDRFVKLKRDVHTGHLYAVNEYGQMVVIRGGKVARERHYGTEDAFEKQSVSPQRLNGLQVDFSKTADNDTRYRIIAGLPGQYFVYFDRKVVFFQRSLMSTAIAFPGKPYFEPFPSEPNMRKRVIAQTKELISVDNFMNIGGKLFYHLGSEGSHLLRLSGNGAVPVQLSGDILQNVRYAAGEKSIRIVANRVQGQAFAVLAGSIYRIAYSAANDRLDTQLLVENFNIDHNLVYSILYDQANRTLFLGSFSQGLTMIRSQLFNVVNNRFQENFHKVFYAHLPFSAASVIIPSGDILGDYKPGAESGLGFRIGQPTFRLSMVKDRNGRFWIAKRDSLYRLPADGSLAEAKWSTGRLIERLYEAPDGNIWLGFKNGEVAYLKPGRGNAEQPVVVAKTKGFSTFIYQDKPGRMWLGTNFGLFLYDSLKRATYPVKGLLQKSIRSIYAPVPDELWVTTYGDGIFLLTQNRLIRVPLDESGYLLHAHYIIQDKQDHFWIPTNKGLFRASRADLLAYARGQLRDVFYLFYNREDGLLTNEFNGGCQPCAAKLADGTYSLPSMRGLVWFKPDLIPLPDLHAPMVFENLRVDDHPVALTDTIRLPYNFSHAAFEVKSPFNGLPENLKMHYALADCPSAPLKWRRVPASQSIDIHRMPAGTYLLAVRKTTGFAGKYIEKKLVVVVAKAWFLSWWFIALALLALALLFWFLTKWRLHSLTQQNLILGQKVEERTVHLTKALDDLKASDEALQMQLQIQMRIIGVINHDLHSPLRYLSRHVPSFLDQITPYLPDQQTVKLGSAISKSTTKVYQLADDLLRFIKATYNKKGKIVYERIAIDSIIVQKTAFFTEIARENQITLSARCEPGLTVTTNYMMLEIMIHNLLDNALKHTFGQSVTVKAIQGRNGEVVISVIDKGDGMQQEVVDWLNHKDAQLPGNLGLGLIIVKEIAMLLGVTIAASSSTKGTTVGLHFSE